MAYEIGYRKPPPSGQFKKGKSGNPKGRPKGSNNFQTLLEQELAQTIVVNENGRRRSMTRLQAMVKRIVAAALQGEVKQVQLLVGLMRREDAASATDELLPDNYEALLEAYVADRGRPATRKSTAPAGVEVPDAEPGAFPSSPAGDRSKP
jgi:hypothetical protein